MPGKAAQLDLRALRSDLREADDRKIMRIVAMLDATPELPLPEALLTTLRSRLVVLRPSRPLRFSRLLFIPLNEVIVPPLGWQPGLPLVPRSVLATIAGAVRTALGAEAAAIEAMIAGHDSNAEQTITQAGGRLWPRAGELLAELAMPPDWTARTGLATAHYRPLTRAIAAVLRRAVRLRQLAQDAEIGVLEPSQQILHELLQGMTGEPPEGSAMIIKLLLGYLPGALGLLRNATVDSGSPAANAVLKTAVNQGMDAFLTDLDAESELVHRLRHAPLAAVGIQVRRIAALLQEIENNPDPTRPRPALKAMRAVLDGVCRARFTEELRERIIGPVAGAAAPVDTAAQRELEATARGLRALETTGRKLGSRATYDNLLQQASAALQNAARAGHLTPVRRLRLLELLAGPDAAQAAYVQGGALAPGGSTVQIM